MPSSEAVCVHGELCCDSCEPSESKTSFAPGEPQLHFYSFDSSGIVKVFNWCVSSKESSSQLQ